MIKLTHVLGHRGSEFPNIITTDCRTIQIVLFMLHLRRGTDFTHNWPRMTPGLISHVHNSFEVYLWQTRHTSGHFNMNAGVKGDDGEQGKTGNAVSCRVPPRRVNVGCLWSLSCVWNELLVPATITHTHTHTIWFSPCQALCHSLKYSCTWTNLHIPLQSHSGDHLSESHREFQC